MRLRWRAMMALAGTALASAAVVGGFALPAEASTRLEAENSTLGSGTCGDNQSQYTYTTGQGETVVFNGGDNCTMTFNASSATSVERIRWFGGGTAGDICGVFIVKQGGVEKARTASTCSNGGSATRQTPTFPAHTLTSGSFQVIWDANDSWLDAHVDYIDIADSTNRHEAENSSFSGTCGDNQSQYVYTTGQGETVVFNGGDNCTMTFANSSTTSVQRIRWFGGGTAGDICGVFIVKQGGAEKARTASTCSNGGSATRQTPTFPAHTLTSGSFQVIWDANDSWLDAHVDYIETGAGTTPPPCGNPTATLNPASQSGTAPYNATFTLGSAAGAGCSIASHVLDFGDSSNQPGGGAPPATATHTYNNPGTYTATLTVTQSDGKTASATASVTANGPAPGNDNFSGATAISIFPFTDTKSTTTYTVQAGEPTPTSCASSIGKTAWYKLAPDATFDVTADTVGGTNFDTVLGIWSGTSLTSLTAVACNDQIDGGNQSRVSFRAHAGTTYYIQVAGWQGSSGTYQLDVTGQVVPAAPGAPRNVTVTAPAAGQLRLTWTAPATGSPFTAYRIYVGSTRIAEVNGLTTNYTESNLNPGWRAYTVTAVNAGGESAGANAIGKAYADYRIELKAFISHPRVVDPRLSDEDGYSYSDATFRDGGACHDNIGFNPVGATVYGWFRGDNHPDFDGSHRTKAVITIRWDGENMLQWAMPNEAMHGVSHRDRLYDAVPPWWDKECTLESGAPTEHSAGFATGWNSFRLEYESDNVLQSPSPAIDGWLTGTFEGARLHLAFDTNQFPNHAWRVTRNGVNQMTGFSTDVRCLTNGQVMGDDGLTKIGWGLNNWQGTATFTVEPHHNGATTYLRNSKLCYGYSF